jgi:hypothetical protein
MTEKHFTIAKLSAGMLEVVVGEKGFLFTLNQLLRRPGASLRMILEGQIGKFNEPIRFLLYSVGLAALTMNLIGALGIEVFQIQELGQSIEQLDTAATELESLRDNKQSNPELQFRVDRALAKLNQSRIEWQMEVILQWINVFLLIAVPVYAAGTFLLFPRGLNFAEHLVVNAYIYGVQCCMSVVLAPISIWNYTAYTSIYLAVTLVYQVFAWQQVFAIRSWKDWLLCSVLICGSIVAYVGITAVAVFALMILLLLIF